jgi:cobalt-zinc-cadmium efflux system outer membrane protein
LQLPPLEAKEERERAIDRQFPPLPPPGPNPTAPAPDGRPLELADLQRLAMAQSPVVRQAVADVEAAQGAAVQAGLYPNPTLALSANDVRLGNTPGAFGAGLEQTVVTAGKRKWARAVAEREVQNAELALQRAQSDVMTQVRQGYFAVLTAQEAMKIALAFAHFTEEIYRIQVEQLRGAQVAAYEPLQFRALAVQARATLVQARNRYQAAWKQLAAAVGRHDMPPVELAGRADMPLPRYDADRVAALVLARHTDVLTAENTVARAREELRLQQVTPVPDLTVAARVARDFTNPPGISTTAGVDVTVPLPVWDRNQGHIRQAEAQLLRASLGAERARNDLSGRLADAFARYQSARQLIAFYRELVIPDQVQVFRRIFERYHLQPANVSYNDVSTAQQNLANTLTAYVGALGDAWNAVVEIAGLLQTTDLFQVGPERVDGDCVSPLPDLKQVLRANPAQKP